jgi:hypothetical protein
VITVRHVVDHGHLARPGVGGARMGTGEGAADRANSDQQRQQEGQQPVYPE